MSAVVLTGPPGWGCTLRQVVATGRWTTLLMVTAAFAVVYLWTVGDLDAHGWREPSGWMVADPLARAVERRGFLHFEAVAVLTAGPVTWLVSPVNTLIGLALGALVALNLRAALYAARCRGGVCRTGGGSGLFPALPALLAGSACCAPFLALALGLQLGAASMALFNAALPLAFALLIAALIWSLYRARHALKPPTGTP